MTSIILAFHFCATAALFFEMRRALDMRISTTIAYAIAVGMWWFSLLGIGMQMGATP